MILLAGAQYKETGRTGWDGGTVENGDAGQSRFDVWEIPLWSSTRHFLCETVKLA
ncbi:MAG: hypothetical protein P8X79_09295 [Reinekea sp.]